MDWLPRLMEVSKACKIGRESNRGASAVSSKIAARMTPGVLPKQTGISATLVVIVSHPTPVKRNLWFSNFTCKSLGMQRMSLVKVFLPTGVRWHPVSTTAYASSWLIENDCTTELGKNAGCLGSTS